MSRSGDRIGFGIIGTGAIAAFHARAIGLVPNAVLRAVATRDPAKARDFAECFRTVAESDLTSLLSRPDIDVVCITTPSGLHGEIACAALLAGKHVLCEKPLEISTERIDQILATGRSCQRHVGLVMQSRFGAGAQALKRAIVQGRFGRLTVASAYVKWWRSDDYYRQSSWRGTWALDGGGALMNQGVHSVDLLVWLVGMPTAVAAFSCALVHPYLEVEDTLTAALHFENGALGVIECATSCAPGTGRRIEISGSGGSATLEEDCIVRWDFTKPEPGDEEIRLNRSGGALGGGSADPQAISIEGHRRSIEDITEALRTGKTPKITGTDGRRAVAVIEAIYAAAQTSAYVTPK